MASPEAFQNLLNSVNQGIGVASNEFNKRINNPLVNMAVGQPFNFNDPTGTVTIDPRGSIVGNATNGWRFGIDAANQNAFIGKGMFDLSGGIYTTPTGSTEPQVNLRFDTKLNNPQPIEPVNMQQFLNQPKMIDPRDAAAQAELNAMRLPQARYW